MSFARSHVVVLLVITVPILIGIFYGSRVAADVAVASQAIPIPITTDPRHPVEVYIAPLFVRTLPAVLEAISTTSVPEDRVQMVPPASYGLGGQLVITRALPVMVTDAGTTTTFRTWAETVGDLLTEQKVELGDRDRVVPLLETQLGLEQAIIITRVSVVEVKKTETIAFTSKTINDPETPRGQQQIVQKGEKGSRVLTYQVTRENSQETGRKLLKTDVTKEPVAEIVSVGTKVQVLGSGRATWYDPPWSGLTAAHNTLPKGTMVDVVNIANGKRVTVKINDRGIQSDAVIDLSPEAFRELATLGTGVISVRLEIAG